MSKPEKEVTLSQTTGKIWTAYRNQHCSLGPEIRDSVILERKTEGLKKKNSETHKLKRKNWARQDTRKSLTTQCRAATNGA